MVNVMNKPETGNEWDKFYSVYMFDNIKYHKLCKQQPNVDRSILKNQCYVFDENGQRVHLGDEKHIYRISTLHHIQELLATYCPSQKKKITNYWDKHCSGMVKFTDFTFFYERYDVGTYEYGIAKVKQTNQLTLFNIEKPSNIFNISEPHEIYQVELNNTWRLSLKQRIKLHAEVLRLCRKGVDIKCACRRVLSRFSKV